MSSGARLEPDDRAARAFAAWEIISVTLSFLLLIWIVLPLSGYNKALGAAFIAVCFVFMFASHRMRQETLRDIGWRLDNFFAAMRWVILLTVILTIPLIAAGWLLANESIAPNDAKIARFLGTDDLRASDGARVLWRLAMIFSGLTQQYLMQGFINRRAQIVFGRGSLSVLVVGLIFALLHLPNAWLASAAFVEGLGWAFIFQRAPNLFALAISHAVITRLTIALVPDHTLQGLRVGFRFFS